MSSPPAPVVLFDGLCTLCDTSVQFLLDRDRGGVLTFASLQSEVGRALAGRDADTSDVLDTIVLVADGRTYVRSDAVLEIATRLPAPWSWLRWLRIVPRPIRDAAYRVVARHRVRWFGRRTECRIPTPALRARFLDALP